MIWVIGTRVVSKHVDFQEYYWLYPLPTAPGYSNKWLCWPGPSSDWYWAYDQCPAMGKHTHITWRSTGSICHHWMLSAPSSQQCTITYEACHLWNQPSHNQSDLIDILIDPRWPTLFIPVHTVLQLHVSAVTGDIMALILWSSPNEMVVDAWKLLCSRNEVMAGSEVSGEAPLAEPHLLSCGTCRSWITDSKHTKLFTQPSSLNQHC